MKILKYFLVGVGLVLATSVMGQTFNALPQVMILGKPYYRYTVKSGDSLYGISKEHNWDQELIKSLNPDAVKSLKDGAFLYYPIENTPIVAADDNKDIRHKIKSGETVYSIAKFYNVTTEEIYTANPGSEYGIKEGSELLIPGKRMDGSDGFVKHKVQPGETLYSVAKRYNSTVSQIMHDNPGVSDHNFQAGAYVKVAPDSNRKTVRQEVTTSHLISVKPYRVKGNETWEDIARKQKLSPSLLHEANPGVGHLSKGMVLVIPNTVSVTEEKEVPLSDPRETTPEGRAEIYEEVQQAIAEEQRLKDIRAAIVIEEATNHKDMEFTRGFIQAIDNLKNSPYKITLTVVEGKNPDIIAQLTEFQPNIIFSTSDKNLPAEVASYGRKNDAWVVNVFDTRNDSYVYNPRFIQLLAPSQNFNNAISNFAESRFEDYNLIVVDEPESSDAISQMVIGKFDPTKVTVVNSDEIKDYILIPGVKYLIYGSASAKKDVEKLLKNIIELKETDPSIKIETFGRPSWIAHSSLMEDFSAAETYIPSRFYFDAELSSSRNFINTYKTLYGHTPVKSFPVYAVTGYDVASYFIPEMYSTKGDLRNASDFPMESGLQNRFELTSESNSSGMVNPIVYILKFNTFGNIDKIEIQ